MTEKPEERRVAVIVLDGADFQVLDQLKEDGEIPNIRKMEENGISTEFTTPESFSPQGWTKMGTGMSTENISVERKWTYETEEGREKRLDSEAIENRRFWSYLNEDGIETGIYQWLMTWPVEPVKGFMTSSYLTGDLNEMSYPEDINLSDEDLKRSLVQFETFEISDKLTDEYYGTDVLVYGFHISDRLQHGFWKFIDEDDSDTQKYRDLIYRPYKEVDELVGRLRPEYTVILVSDHGFEERWTDTYKADINDLLKSINLTDYRLDKGNMARAQDFDSEAPIIHRSGQNEQLNKTHYRVRLQHNNKDIEAEYLREELKKIKFTGGDRLLKNVTYVEGYFEAVIHLDSEHMGQEYYDERHMRLAYARGNLPILQQKINVVYEGSTYESKIGPLQTGDHPVNTDGVFYAAGEGIKEMGRSDVDIKAKDLAPLVLYLKGVDIPEKMDGDVPRNIIKQNYLLFNSPKYSDIVVKQDNRLRDERNETQDERINERLEDLGYNG